jgi:hypothetical protein
VTGCFDFRTAFFTGVRLGWALARPCTFDPFLRFAMIEPLGWCCTTH